MPRFTPAVEALEGRDLPAPANPAPDSFRKAYDGWLKKELEFLDRQTAQRMRRSTPAQTNPRRPSASTLRRVPPGANPPLPGAPGFRLAPYLALQAYWAVWSPRVEKLFSIGDNRLKDQFALTRGDAAIIPGVGVYMLVKPAPAKPAPRVPHRPAVWVPPARPTQATTPGTTAARSGVPAAEAPTMPPPDQPPPRAWADWLPFWVAAAVLCAQNWVLRRRGAQLPHPTQTNFRV